MMRTKKDIEETAEEFCDQVLQTVGICMDMVIKSNGVFNRNQLSLPLQIGEKEYELVFIFKEKGIDN